MEKSLQSVKLLVTLLQRETVRADTVRNNTVPRLSQALYVKFLSEIHRFAEFLDSSLERHKIGGSYHKRQKPQAPTPQAPIRNRQTRKVANAKGLNSNNNLT